MREVNCAVCGNHNTELLTVARGNRNLQFISKEHPVVICTSCGLTYLNPQQDEEDYARYYRSSDYKPITIAPEVLLDRHIYRRIQAAFLLNTVRSLWRDRDVTSLNTIDIGCGPGILLHYLAEAGLNVTGLEASKDAADYAENSFGLNIIRGSINSNLLPEKAFDIAVSTAAIEHFTDPLAALVEMRRSLVPNGLLYINTPDLLGMVLKKGEGNQFKFVHTYYFTEASLSNLIGKAGFKVIRSWTMPPQLHASIIYPGNYCSGELNIVAVNDSAQGDFMSRPRRVESAKLIKDAYHLAKERDRIHAWARRAAYWRPIAKIQSLASRFIQARPVFDSFIAIDGTIDTTKFPPIIHTQQNN